MVFFQKDSTANPAQAISADELIPIAAISLAIFLLKTGVLSGILVGLKKLWQRIRKK
jgi:hypothetical protein